MCDSKTCSVGLKGQVIFGVKFFFCLSTPIDRVKKRVDMIGAFKMEPLYLKHENQESGRVISLKLFQSIITDQFG